MKIIETKIVSAFGRAIIKPKNDEAIRYVKALKQKSFTIDDLRRAKGLGFGVYLTDFPAKYKALAESVRNL